MRKVKTHFEQIPVEMVKKITEEEEADEREVKSPNVVVETPATKTEPYSVSSSMLCRKPA